MSTIQLSVLNQIKQGVEDVSPQTTLIHFRLFEKIRSPYPSTNLAVGPPPFRQGRPGKRFFVRNPARLCLALIRSSIPLRSTQDDTDGNGQPMVSPMLLTLIYS